MIYNVANTLDAGKAICVFDANGLEYKRLIELDSETGRAVQIKDYDNGNGEPTYETVYLALPVLVKPRYE